MAVVGGKGGGGKVPTIRRKVGPLEFLKPEKKKGTTQVIVNGDLKTGTKAKKKEEGSDYHGLGKNSFHLKKKCGG